MKKRNGRHPRGAETVPLRIDVPVSGTVSVGCVGLLLERAQGRLSSQEEGRPCACQLGWVLYARGRKPRRQRRGGLQAGLSGCQTAEAGYDALGLAYGLLNVHVHLLFVVDLGDPRGIGGAGRCEWFGRRKAHSAHGRMPDAGTEGIGMDAACPGWVNSNLALPAFVQRQHRDGGEAARRERPACLRRQTGARRSCGLAVRQTYRRRVSPVEATDEAVP